MDRRALDVLDFWWKAGPEAWFRSDPEFDAQCLDRCGGLYRAAADGALSDWESNPAGSLALVILLDQIPRNVFRNTAQAFETDGLALNIAERAIGQGFDLAYPVPQKKFFYLPYTHAEDMAAQQRCVDLNRVCDDMEGYHYALIHMDVIRRFGRFPHRNAVLGRDSTPEEIAYLETGGFSG